MKYQDVQENCYQEVMRVTGEERPSLSHSLPYCQAVIHEVQRLACVAPQTIPHRYLRQGQNFSLSHFIFRATKDVSVEGYDVLKDYLFVTNLWGFMKDPDHWEAPEMF